MNTNGLRPVIKVQIFEQEKCFGPGIATLLQNVNEMHSLRSACKKMNMSYSKAWTIIKHSEEQLGFKLLSSTTGGANGGGAEVTNEAKEFLDKYQLFSNEVKQYALQLFEEYFV